jgi:hypothetical protein
MSEGGTLYDTIKPTADASGMFDNLRKLIPAARSAGIKVFTGPHFMSIRSVTLTLRGVPPPAVMTSTASLCGTICPPSNRG